jgi:endoglucanase
MLKLASIAVVAFSGAAALSFAATRSEGSGAATPPSRLAIMGINLASAEFAPTKLPGVHGKDYIYPTANTVEPFVRMGMNAVRIPILWERLQPEPMGALDPKELARLDKSVQAMGNIRTIIIDVHNYGRYRGRPLNDAEGARLLSDLWSRLASRYRSSPNVAFGMMNEPYGIRATQWRAVASATIRAIRATGARNLVLVPGTRWTGAHSWGAGGPESNAAAFSDFRDPGGNFAFELHQYLDGNSSGTSRQCVDETVGSRRLREVTRWLRAKRARGVLAEFGASDSPTCLAALSDMLRFMSTNSDVWLGWTYWAGGDWWGGYPFSIQPGKGGVDKPQARVLQRYLMMP